MSKQIVYVSPSQIKVWDLCKRKWAFGKIDKVREPSTPKQAFGTAGHSQLEGWLEHGIAPDDSPAGKCAKQGIRKGWLPAPAGHLKIEHKFDFKIFEDEDIEVRMLGYIDCLDPVDALVIDHKFTGDLKWALTPEALSTDAQGIIYSRYAHEQLEVDKITARWVYYSFNWPSKTPKGQRKVEYVFDWSTHEVQEMWSDIVLTAIQIARAKVTWKNANEDAPANANACGVYGGCYFRNHGCKIEAKSIFAAAFTQHEREHGKRSKQLTQSDNKVKIPTGGYSMSDMTLEERLATMKSAQEKGQDVLKMRPADADKGGLFDKMKTSGDAKGVNPPEGRAPEKTEADTTPVVKDVEDMTKADLIALAADKGIEVTKTWKREKILEAVMGGVQLSAPPVDKEPTVSRETSGTLTVVFDAVIAKPNGKTQRHLIDVLRPIMKAVADREGVPHWALAKHYVAGRAMLMEEFTRLMQVSKPTGYLIVDSDTQEAKAVKDVLVEFADEIIQGV